MQILVSAARWAAICYYSSTHLLSFTTYLASRHLGVVRSPSSATFQALRGRLDMVLKFPAKEREAADLLAVPAGPPLTAHDILP